jgi:hypothetical protein
VIEPNRLTPPGEAAARARIEVVFEAVDRLSAYVLAQAVIGRTDPDERDRRRARLEDAVGRSDRGALLDAARAALNHALQAKVSASLVGTAYGVIAASSGRVDDRVAVFQALDDAVGVAVAEDLLEVEDARALSDPGRALLGLPPVGTDALEPRPGDRGERGAWEPTDADWVDARRSAASGSNLLPGVRGLWQVFLGVIAVAGIVLAIAFGLTGDQPWLGLLAAVAIGAVCWTLATFRRAT